MKRFLLALLTIYLLAATALAAPEAIAVDGLAEGCIDAAEHGVRPENKPVLNTLNLQRLIDRVSETGGSIFLPAGEYRFAQQGNQTIGSHCIKMRSDVRLKGEGEDTVLLPVGESAKGLDMFYFNDYLDYNQPNYLENCSFSDFVIDASGTWCRTYTSAGKGFMFNLFRNCYWSRITVRHTDATGFGVDCPMGGSMTDCRAEYCGKAANTASAGASGFGIGFGYSNGETFRISRCTSIGNRKFGFFFEHQGVFNPIKYASTEAKGFFVTNCVAAENYYNFGGIKAMDLSYEACRSTSPRQQGYYFEDCANCTAIDCMEE